jgi:hypothetical protein
MIRGLLPLVLATAGVVAAQKYNGPAPPKPDLPFLKHADHLVPTEAVEVKQENKGDEVTYVIPGPASAARTPLAEPVFLFQSDKLTPDRFGLYKIESRNGRREVTASAKKPLEAIRIVVGRLSGNLYKIEVDETLEPGEYFLSPAGPNLTAFCFAVF